MLDEFSVELLQDPLELGVIPVVQPTVLVPLEVGHVDNAPARPLEHRYPLHVGAAVGPPVFHEVVRAIHFDRHGTGSVLVV